MNEKSLMQRCLDLARKGTSTVSPNPMVGCVIVKGGNIIAEGFHRKFGGPHAEIIALMYARNKVKNSTLYINLEPCVHFGKTPPCTDAIVQSGISRVVIAMKDPNPLVSGKGIRRLREAGIDVKVGVPQKEAELLNEKFLKFMKTGLPFTGIKLAQTLDGKIADKSGNSKWITSEAARKMVHRLRSEYDAILVGANTVLKDNPELTVRLVKGRNPVRLVVDGRLSVPVSRKIFNINKAPTWLLTSTDSIKSKNKKVYRLVSQGVRVLGISSSSFDLKPKSVLKILSKEGISSVLIEGGSQTAASFIKQVPVDKLYLFISPKILGGGLEAFHFEHPQLIKNSIKLKINRVSSIGEDVLVEAKF